MRQRCDAARTPSRLVSDALCGLFVRQNFVALNTDVAIRLGECAPLNRQILSNDHTGVELDDALFPERGVVALRAMNCVLAASHVGHLQYVMFKTIPKCAHSRSYETHTTCIINGVC